VCAAEVAARTAHFMSHADDGKVVQAAALLQASFRRSLR